jgi:2-polyprenyl-3-methyl-5-hydroxy-6-metoxy-1,4-benzoquinol methylase
MQENRYIHQDSADVVERERIALLEQTLDPITIRRLDRIEVQPGWQCLEVGAGGGSMARWLANTIGPHGQVVATDINPRFLLEPAPPNLKVRSHNILIDALEPAHYDLVHCRALLMHLPQPLVALERMAAAVRPGGWLFIEEFDSLSFGAVEAESATAQAFNRTMQVIIGSLRAARVMDMLIGRRLRTLVEGLGFVALQNEGTTWVNRGGEPRTRFHQMNLPLLRPLVAAGKLTDDDLALMDRQYADPAFTFVDFTLFGVWGQRVAGPGESHNAP